MKTLAFTDTARDEWSVLAALDRPDLNNPSLVDIADVIRTVKNADDGRAATLAWLLGRSHDERAELATVYGKLLEYRKQRQGLEVSS